MTGRWAAPALEAALLVLLALFHLLTLRQGQYWGDDFAQYVLHAQNLAAGRAYAETPWLPNPGYAQLGPRAYPPLYPALLAVVVRARGLDPQALKLPGVLALLLCVFFLNRLAARGLPAWARLLPGLLFGLNPFLWDFKDSILSDLPFAALLLGAATLQGRARVSGRHATALEGALLGAIGFLAFATRSVGALLPAAALFVDWRERGRLAGGFVAAVLGVCAGLALFLHALLPMDRSQVEYFHTSARIVANNVAEYLSALGGFWENGFSDVATAVLFVAATCLAALGFRARWRAGLGLLEVFGAVYLALLLLWPGGEQGTRFLLPVLPGYCLCAVEGGCLWWHAWKDRPKRARVVVVCLVSLLAAIAFSYVGRSSRLDGTELRSGIGTAPARELFRFVAEKLPPEAVLVFRKPRALALLTGRRATMYSPAEKAAGLWTWGREVGVTHVVVGRRFDLDAKALSPAVAAAVAQGRMARVWRNADFEVYELR
ncbi:MAG: hypothetical protein HYZ53_17275 [Planctomycetes bacterium]|nr:hypothetical protein [Planctomycetota bacterium]